MSTLNDRIDSPGPKRILALDGGGIKGVLTLQILKKMESLIRDKHGQASLADYFDLIGGTSTGAIIAGALAIGKSVDEVVAMYDQLGDTIFAKKWYRKGLLAAKFSEGPLRAALNDFFGDTRLGDEAVRTGLGVVTKRLDTGSVWIVHNSPHCSYQESNQALPLQQIIRASTAAPHYFEPEEIVVDAASSRWGLFVDGGVSPHNNPSLQLLMLATLTGHGFNWRDNPLSLHSVGTGFVEFKLDYQRRTGLGKLWHAITRPGAALASTAAPQAVLSLSSLMHDNACLVELMMQWLSDGQLSSKRVIDSEIGDLGGDLFPGLSRPLLAYQRYDAVFDREWLDRELGMALPEDEVKQLAAMDEPRSMERLKAIGRAVADKRLDASQF